MVQTSTEQLGFDFSTIDTYSGYYIDNNQLLRSASGGAVSAISEAIIEQGGIVFGVAYSNDFKRAEYKIVEKKEDLEPLKGSKYCETIKTITLPNGGLQSIYITLEEKLKENRLVLFVGLGCDVGGIKAYCEAKKIETSKLYTIDILCHGPTSSLVQQQYIEYLERKYHSKVVFFSVRYKKRGWTPPFIRAKFENGNVYETPFYESDYGFAFSHYSKEGCYNCRFKGINHKADLTCGDFWGLTQSMSGWNSNGVSIMFVKTPKGEELISMIDIKKFHIEKADTAFALLHNPMYYNCKLKDKNYEQFSKNLKEKGLHYAVKHYPIGVKARIKKTIKSILKAFWLK